MYFSSHSQLSSPPRYFLHPEMYPFNCTCFKSIISPFLLNQHSSINHFLNFILILSIACSVFYLSAENLTPYSHKKASLVTCNVGDPGSIPGLGRSSGEGNSNPLQYSCLDNPMDRGAWRATVHEISESDTTEQLTHIYTP